jgi:hypothetical protein
VDIGYHHVTTTRLAAQAGATWSRYPPAITHSHLTANSRHYEYASPPHVRAGTSLSVTARGHGILETIARTGPEQRC